MRPARSARSQRPSARTSTLCTGSCGRSPAWASSSRARGEPSPIPPLSLALRPGVPGSMHGLAEMTDFLHLRAWPEIVHAVKTGDTSFGKVFGKEIFEHVTDDAEAGRAFDEAMAAYTAATSSAVIAAY